MRRKLGKALFASTGFAALVVSAASLALANLPERIETEDLVAATAAETAVLPQAAGGVALFVNADGSEAAGCIASDDVLAGLDRDRVRIGGETVMLETGFDQAFADEWRRETSVDPVRVSAVYGHIFANDGGFGMVDVVELGADGCAISRTILTEDEWNAILVRAAGVEV
jgi:hypothetical protein